MKAILKNFVYKLEASIIKPRDEFKQNNFHEQLDDPFVSATHNLIGMRVNPLDTYAQERRDLQESLAQALNQNKLDESLEQALIKFMTWISDLVELNTGLPLEQSLKIETGAERAKNYLAILDNLADFFRPLKNIQKLNDLWNQARSPGLRNTLTAFIGRDITGRISYIQDLLAKSITVGQSAGSQST